MQSTLIVYDIAESLKIANPSPVMRRHGVRLNLSCWVVPCNLVPTDFLEKLRSQGADVHLLQFADGDWDKVLALAKDALKRHCRDVTQMVRAKSLVLQNQLTLALAGDDSTDKNYKRWRSILSRGRREALATEQCAMGFGLTHDCQEALDGLKNTLAAEMDKALAWRDRPQTAASTAPAPANDLRETYDRVVDQLTQKGVMPCAAS